MFKLLKLLGKGVKFMITGNRKYKDELIIEALQKDLTLRSINENLIIYNNKKQFSTHYLVGNRQVNQNIQSLGLAKQSTNFIASLIMSEKVEIKIDNNESLNEALQDILKENCFIKNSVSWLETALALGGGVLKVHAYEDYLGESKIGIDFVSANQFIPISWNNKEIFEGAFISDHSTENKKYMLVERHEWQKGENGSEYVISNELYEVQNNTNINFLGSRETKGKKVPLATLFPDMEEQIIIENLKRPLFAYFKTASANNIDLNSPLGISIYENAKEQMKTVDIIFDRFQKEYKLGQLKLGVPTQATTKKIDRKTGQTTTTFDPNTEVFFNSGNIQGDKLEAISINIRSQELKDGINTSLDLFTSAIGLSKGTFSMDALGQAITATEVISRNSDTFRTKKAHENNLRETFVQMVDSIISMGALVDSIPMSANDLATEVETCVTFDDSIITDDNKRLEQAISLNQNGILSKKTILIDHWDMTEQEADEELNQIEEEKPEDLYNLNDMLGDGEEDQEEEETPEVDPKKEKKKKEATKK